MVHRTIRLRVFLGTNLGLAILYLSAITLAEVITTIFEPRLGLVLHGAVLLAILLHASLGLRGKQQAFLLSQALAPLVRIFSLALPLKYIPFIYWYVLVGTPLLIAAILTARVIGLRREQMGLTIKAVPLQIIIAFTGIGLGFVEYHILRPLPLAQGFSLDQIWLPALILLIFTGFLEEVIFRGIMYYVSLRSLGRAGIYFAAAIFAVLHIGYKSGLDVLFVFMVAVIFGWMALRTGSILGVTLAHGLTNITLFLVFPFLFTLQQPNPTLLPDRAIVQYTLEASSPTEVLLPTKIGTKTPSPTSKTANSPTISTVTLSPSLTRPLSVVTSTPSVNLPIISNTPTFENPDTIIIDDGDTGLIRQGGNLYPSDMGFGGDFIWAYTTDQNPTVTIIWQPDFTACGQYKVEVYIPSGFNLTRTAFYQVGNRNGMAGRLIDQSANTGNWVLLGLFDFLPTRGSFLRLNNRTDEPVQAGSAIVFDAARWTRVGPCQSVNP